MQVVPFVRAMTGAPRVSVLTCCYNASRWLHEAVDSVLGQTFEDFELILIDDGSTDETLDLIERYRAADRRVVAITKPHGGLTESLNVGIARARGEWIARLDSDDLAVPERLERQVAYVGAHTDVLLLGSGSIEIDGDGRALKEHRYPSHHARLLANLCRLKRFFPHSSAMFHRDSARRVGSYNTRFKKSQDWDLWLRLAEIGSIACLDQSLVKVRRHPHQISSATSGIPQWVYGTAATTCHFLRKRGATDPSADVEDEHWLEFMGWISHMIADTADLERRNAWSRARTALLSRKNKVSVGVEVARYLSKPSHFVFLLRELTLGSWLPQRLADAWAQRSCSLS